VTAGEGPGTSEGPVDCSYKLRGYIFDEDYWPDKDETGTFDWGEPFIVEPGGSPIVFRHNRVVDDEVELRCVLFFTMDLERTLYVAGELQLLEGNKFGREHKTTTTFGPFSCERDTWKDVYTTQIRDNEGDYADVALSISNEGE
jgi:hypothetical protein